MGRKNPDQQLYYALIHGNLKRIKHLVFNEGVCVNYVFMDGSLPLHVAAERGFCGGSDFPSVNEGINRHEE